MNVLEEQLLEQHFNDIHLEPNQESQEGYFNCLEGCNTLTEAYIVSTSCKGIIWLLPLTLY